LKDLSGFKVYRTTQEIGEECDNCDQEKTFHANVDIQYPTSAVISEGEVKYTDNRVEAGNVYHYSVAPYNLKGREGPRSDTIAVVFDEPPPAPRGLTARPGSRGVTLSWQPPFTPSAIRSYRIYRGANKDLRDMKSVGSTRWAETFFVDTDVKKDQTYYYLVRSLKMNRGISLESSPSRAAEAVVVGVKWEPPESVAAALAGEGIRVAWDPVKIQGEETRYNVYRSESGKMYRRINVDPIVYNWFQDTDVGEGKTYRYAVTAFPKGRPEDESSRSASEALKFVR